MATLDTVRKIIDYSRVLLQDTIEPYRYPTAQLTNILNMGLLDMRRLRPDMFLNTPTEVPEYDVPYEPPFVIPFPPPPVPPEQVVAIDQQYRMSLVYFIVGQAQLRDEEDTQDARAVLLMDKFRGTLVEQQTVK